MSSALQIDGKNLYPIKDAAEVVSYSRDYVTRLAREEKIIASLVGRQWFVDVDSLKSYAESSAIEQQLRKKQLSEERKRERQIRDAVEKQNTLHLKKAEGIHLRATAVACLVLGFGLLGGWATDFLTSSRSLPVETGASNVAQVNSSQFEKQKAVTTSPQSVSQSVTSSTTEESSEQNSLVPNFSSRRVEQIEGTRNGFLLLPDAANADIEQLFSDDVVVRVLSTGERVVVLIDNEGNEVGREIPFVEVPVNAESN